MRSYSTSKISNLRRIDGADVETAAHPFIFIRSIPGVSCFSGICNVFLFLARKTNYDKLRRKVLSRKKCIDLEISHLVVLVKTKL